MLAALQVTGKIYHLTFNPPPEDPEVLERLVHRKDDTAEAMGKRINMYHEVKKIAAGQSAR